MKATLLAAAVVISCVGLVSGESTTQESRLEREIRALDAAEADGLLHKDVEALKKIWADDFTVNNPRNSITHGKQEVIALFENGTIDYSSFVREVETMMVHGDTVISMGLETIKPVGKAPFAGQPCAAASRISG